jgi:hypothetical protein
MLLSIFVVTTVADARTSGAGYFACIFDSGLPRIESHGKGNAEIQDGKGEICVPGRPADCEPATRQDDKIVSAHWVLRIDGHGKCKVVGGTSQH